MAVITKMEQVALGVDLLIHQWKDKPIVVALLTSYLNAVQEIEDVYDQLLKERGLDTAVGAQLDVIGLIVGQLRNGLVDSSYRTAIKLRIAINNSDGTEPVVSSLLKQITGADTIIFQENYPAGMIITLEGSLTSLTSDIVESLKLILAATVTAEVRFQAIVVPAFVFLGDPDGEGFADNGVGGGNLTDTIIFTF